MQFSRRKLIILIRVFRHILLCVVVSIFVVPAYGQYGGGSGDAGDPYLIYTAEQMNAIGADSNDWDKHFRPMADIDLSAYTGVSFNIIGDYHFDNGTSEWVGTPFSGVFDGRMRKISNFTHSSASGENIGIFGSVKGPLAVIKNVVLIK